MTRTTALSVFIYRRVAVKISRKQRLDDYRTVGFQHKVVSIVITYVLLLLLVTGTLIIFKPVAAEQMLSGVNQSIHGK